MSVTGCTTVLDDGAPELTARLAARYWDLDERADDVAALLAGDNVHVVLHSESVQRFTF